MPKKLDELDTKILGLLRTNSRRSSSEIARSVSLSEPAVRKRIRRLVADGGIQFSIFMDPNKMELMSAMIGIKVEPTAVDEVAAAMARLTTSVYVAVVTGPFDVLTYVVVRGEAELYDLLRLSVATLPGVRETTTMVVLKAQTLSYEEPLNALHSETAEGSRKRESSVRRTRAKSATSDAT